MHKHVAAPHSPENVLKLDALRSLLRSVFGSQRSRTVQDSQALHAMLIVAGVHHFNSIHCHYITRHSLY